MLFLQEPLRVRARLLLDGLPVRMHIPGSGGSADVVLRLGRIYEQARPWPLLAPNFSNQ
jgi:hypothetical protein